MMEEARFRVLVSTDTTKDWYKCDECDERFWVAKGVLPMICPGCNRVAEGGEWSDD